MVITGQSLVEAVDRGRVSLQHFSLLVLDECHHTRGGHPLRGLMNQYMQLKFGDRCSELPQVSLISPIYPKVITVHVAQIVQRCSEMPQNSLIKCNLSEFYSLTEQKWVFSILMDV